jgi:hypothetical protein
MALLAPSSWGWRFHLCKSWHLRLLGLSVHPRTISIYGVTCAQTCRFYRLYPTERWYLKTTVKPAWLFFKLLLNHEP